MWKLTECIVKLITDNPPPKRIENNVEMMPRRRDMFPLIIAQAESRPDVKSSMFSLTKSFAQPRDITSTHKKRQNGDMNRIEQN